MTSTVGFLTFLGLTVVLLLGVLWTGYRARRRQHLPLVALTVGSLLATIYYAKQLGLEYDLESAGAITPVHLFLAKVATGAYVLPLGTGLVTLKNPRVRKAHGRVAFVVLGLTVAALVTGAWMLLAATPLPAAG